MRYLVLLLALLPTLAIAQTQPPEAAPPAPPTVNPAPAPAPARGTTCIGGKLCAERRLRVPLEDRPVIEVRFRAHDAIGQAAGGVLRVKIDGNVVRSGIDIPRAGQTFTLDVDELRGRYLVFEPEEDDEVEISAVQVVYGRDRGVRPPRDPYGPPRGGGRDGWRSYPRAEGCIGGNQCRQNGNRITVALESAPVVGVRFYAHDNVGQRADGKLTVRIDSTNIGFYIDVQRNGKRHDLEVDNLRGTRLVIETASDDEVEVSEVEVLYGRRGGSGGGGGRGPREITDDGECIGGDECGGSRARIRIPLRFRPVESVRFYARDDVGSRAGGELRIRIDDEIIRDYLDIPREGRTFTIDGNGIEGEYLIIEVTEDDEVVVKDIRVRFREEDDDDDY